MIQVDDTKRRCTCPNCAAALIYSNGDLCTFQEPVWGGIFVRDVRGLVCPVCNTKMKIHTR